MIDRVFDKLAKDLSAADKMELMRWLATVRTRDVDITTPFSIDHGKLIGLADNDHPQYALAAKGVTNGDSHNHDGGDGGQIDHTKLATIGTKTHAQIDTYISTDAKFHALTVPLTSTSFDGDSFSTTAKTLIDLSAVFNVPAGVKAILAHTKINDSGSAAGSAFLILSPTNDANEGPYVHKVSGFANDYIHHHNGVVPCDANGDIYYQIAASGAGTEDVKIEIWGYWL